MSDSVNDSPEYLYNTAVSYLKGDGVPADSAKAAELFELAARQNYLPAIRDLGILYLNGDGVAPDAKRAYELISKSAEKMDPNAIYHLALMYENGVGVDKDPYEALRLMAFCAGAGYTGAVEDADRIEEEIDAIRNKKLDARPILKLEVSDVDVEACCCKKMFDAVKANDIYLTDTYDGPQLIGSDEDGNEMILRKCPFCGQTPQKVPRNKEY